MQINCEGRIALAKRKGIIGHPHQEAGVKWALEREISGFKAGGVTVRGGILADEMGLGKTYQMMALMISNFVPRTLIVLPRALVEQWAGAVKKALGHEALVYHGSVKRIRFAELSSAPIVITTYGMLTPSKRDGYRPIHNLVWDRVIFDEAHHLRNRGTRVHKGAIALRATRRWLVTGTPIQNSKTDFWALCAALGMDQEYYTDTTNLKKIAQGCILKRTLADAGIKLPELKRHEVRVMWESQEEQDLAEELHAMLSFSGVEQNDDKRPMTNMLTGNQLAALTRARQCCVRPSLIPVDALIDEELGEGSDELRNALLQRSKLNGVLATIAERDNGRSKIVFCHYRGEIDLLASELRRAGKTVSVLDGRTSGKDARTEVLTSRSDVLLMQYQTGCEGLNLQQYTEVYFVSPHWNPAIEDQAVARAWRIGQKDRVDVFRFEMAAFDPDKATRSVDAYVKDVHRRKREVMQMIQEATEEDEPIGCECSVCTEGITKHTCAQLQCGHKFHRTCINQWFQRKRSCPLCRAAT